MKLLIDTHVALWLFNEHDSRIYWRCETISAVNIAYTLTRENFRVLLIDNDKKSIRTPAELGQDIYKFLGLLD